MSEARLERLAEAAGVITEWEDSERRPCRLSEDALRELLGRLGYPAASEAEITASLQKLRQPASPIEWPPMITAEQGMSTPLPSPLPAGTRYSLIFEAGNRSQGELDAQGELPPVSEAGYHRLSIEGSDLTLAVAPPRCYTLADGQEHNVPRLWGLAVQLYALRRPGDGGIGDSLALAEFAEHSAEAGAAALAVSPVHAMFSADVERYSPYSPSSRLLYNVLHCSPQLILGEAAVKAAIKRCRLDETLAELEADELLDWPRAARVKLTWLRALHDDFKQRQDDEAAEAHRALARFREARGDVLETHCRFEALQQHRDEGDWRQWPRALRDPNSPEVARFAEAQADDVDFHVFLQWLASEGLASAQASAKHAGMAVGLIADLAVGADATGSQAWSRQAELLEGLSIGAPPDTFNVHGQDWGLIPFSPQGLVRSGFRSFIDMLRAAFAHAGGLRIDHVLGLMRLWLVPHGAGPSEGGYVRFPLTDLLRLVALESWRHRAIVIGEDLGTVAPGFSERLARYGILGMSVLWFERDDRGEFLPPDEWSQDAIATSSTHDLPTLAGWWAGRDIVWRSGLGLLADDQDAQSEQAERGKDRALLARSLRLVNMHAATKTLDAAELPASRVLDACVERLGSTPAPLTLLPVEDVLGLEEQANLPGTLDEHPNWRRRWADHASQLLTSDEVRQRLAKLAEARREAHLDAKGGSPSE